MLISFNWFGWYCIEPNVHWPTYTYCITVSTRLVALPISGQEVIVNKQYGKRFWFCLWGGIFYVKMSMLEQAWARLILSWAMYLHTNYSFSMYVSDHLLLGCFAVVISSTAFHPCRKLGSSLWNLKLLILTLLRYIHSVKILGICAISSLCR